MPQKITIVGATSGPGKSLFFRLAERGYSVRGIGRDHKKISDIKQRFSDNFPKAEISAIDVALNQSFLDSTEVLIHCSRPELTKGLISSNLVKFIALGSTRKFTQYPDIKSREVSKMESRAFSSNVPATILHPTLIYGAEGLSNVERIIDTAKNSPFIPLPIRGRSLIQPIHNDDVVDAIINCLDNDKVINKSIVIAGPTPITYRYFVKTVVNSMGLSTRIIYVPYFLVAATARITRYIPKIPTIDPAEVKRLLEDKHFDTVDMQRTLGITPRSFETGMAQYANSREPN
mgnify:CR=1 FL=1